MPSCQRCTDARAAGLLCLQVDHWANRICIAGGTVIPVPSELAVVVSPGYGRVSVRTQRGSHPRLCTIPSRSRAASFVGQILGWGRCQSHAVTWCRLAERWSQTTVCLENRRIDVPRFLFYCDQKLGTLLVGLYCSFHMDTQPGNQPRLLNLLHIQSFVLVFPGITFQKEILYPEASACHNLVTFFNKVKNSTQYCFQSQTCRIHFDSIDHLRK